MKICKACKEEKPHSEFSPNRNGLRPDCRDCHNEKSKQSRLKQRLVAEQMAPLSAYQAEALALKYGKNKDWVAKGLQACKNVGVAEDYFVSRYLDRDTSVVRNDVVEMEFKRLSRR